MSKKLKLFCRYKIWLPIVVLLLGCGNRNNIKQKQDSFPYGVASGDPRPTEVVIWTKTIADNAEKNIYWQISRDSLFKNIDNEGFETANATSDFTIKAKVERLVPSTSYYYRFSIDESYSMNGRTKTLPDEGAMPDTFNIALVNCNNFQDGYFNAFNALSKMDDVDLVIHLGDYIYEYEAGRYADTTLVDRAHLPVNEIVSLDDYRTRYAQYRADTDLQKVHAKFPFLFIWDDHEFANDAYATGAKNHDATEGSWQQRQRSAIQAYQEWLPITISPKENPPTQLQIGQLIDLLLLEERASARTKQMDPCELEDEDSIEHTLLGEKQRQTLVNAITTSTKPWTVIANQVAFTGYAKTDPLFSLNYQDWWLGYPNDRKQVLNAFKKAKNKPVILTGDHHRSFVMAVQDDELDPCNPKYVTKYDQEPLAWEVMVPSISSKNHDIYSDSIVSAYTEKLVNPLYNPHIKFADLNSHGFTIMRFTPKKVTAEFVFMETIKSRNSKVRATKKFELPFSE